VRDGGGTLAGEGRLNVGVVFATAMCGWLLGSVAGYEVGRRGGRRLLERPGWLAKAVLGVAVVVAAGLGIKAGCRGGAPPASPGKAR